MELCRTSNLFGLIHELIFLREFIDVMKKRLIRGLDSKRELGVWNKFSALTVCGYEAFAPESVKVFAETVKSGMSQEGNASSFGDWVFFVIRSPLYILFLYIHALLFSSSSKCFYFLFLRSRYFDLPYVTSNKYFYNVKSTSMHFWFQKKTKCDFGKDHLLHAIFHYG